MTGYAHIYVVTIRIRHPNGFVRVGPYLVIEDIVFGGMPVVIPFSLRFVLTSICSNEKAIAPINTRGRKLYNVRAKLALLIDCLF